MNNLYKIFSLCAASFYLAAPAGATEVGTSSQVKAFYAKLQGELVFPAKIGFKQKNAQFLSYDGYEISPKMVGSPGIALGWITPWLDDLSLELSYKRYASVYKQDVPALNHVYDQLSSSSNVSEFAANYTFFTMQNISFFARLGVGVASNKSSVTYLVADDQSRQILPAGGSTISVYNWIKPQSSYSFAFSGGVGVEGDLTSRVKYGIGYNYQNLGFIKTGSWSVSSLPAYQTPKLNPTYSAGEYAKAPKFGPAHSNGVFLYLKYAF